MKDTQGDNNHAYQRFNGFKTYSSILALNLDIQVGNPVSLILFQDGKLECSCIEDNEHVIVEVLLDDKNGYNDHETWVVTVMNEFGENIKFEKRFA